MAKGKSSRSNAHGTPSSLTSLLSPPLPPAIPVSPLTDPVIVKQLNHGRYNDPAGDRRKFHPQGKNRPAHTLIKGATRLVNRPESFLPSFNIPNAIGICVRRKARREILFALDLQNRKGRGSGKPRKRNHYSGIKC